MAADIPRRQVLGGMGVAAVMALLRENHAAALQAGEAVAFATRQNVQPLIPGRLYRIGCTVRAERLSWLADDLPGSFEPLNAYLLIDDQHAVFVDMGAPIMLPAIRQAIDTLVGSRRVWVSYTRNEADCIGNLGWILGTCPYPTLLFGGAGGILEWINDPAVSIMEVRDFLGRVPIVESRNGTTSRIGTLELQWMDAGAKQMLLTQWAFEPTTGCLFTSDSFGFRHLRSVDEAPLVETSRGMPSASRVARELAARMNWMRGATYPDVLARFETLFRERDVQMIAPVHGCVIRGRAAVRAHVQRMLEGMRAASALPSLEETRHV
jgi:flavorubredoxin